MIWKAREIDLSQIQVGSSVSFDVYVDTTLVERFASLSGDYSPLHLDVKYARQSGYDQCVVHGMLMASYFSAIVGSWAQFIQKRGSIHTAVSCIDRPVPSFGKTSD